MPSSEPASAPVAGRYEGKLWTLCDPFRQEGGFCLSLTQAREIRLRFHETLADYATTAVDANERAEKSLAKYEAAVATGNRLQILGAVLGIAAVFVGVGLGIVIGHFGF